MSMQKVSVILGCLVFAAGLAHANLLSNGDFQTEGTNGNSGAQFWDGDVGGTVTFSETWGVANIHREDWPETAAGDYAMYAKGGWAGADTNCGVKQVFSAGISVGETYTLSGQFLKNAIWSGESYFKIEWLDGGGSQLGADEVHLHTAITVNDAWETHSFESTAPVGTVSAQVLFMAFNQGHDGVIGANNLSMVAVPEPVSATLLGLGIVAVYAVRRKIRK